MSDRLESGVQHAIVLPAHWNHFSTLKRTRGRWTRCQACFWSGDPGELFRPDDDITLRYEECREAAAGDEGCVSCKVITRLMEAVGLPGSEARGLGLYRGPAFGPEDAQANIDTHWTVFVTGSKEGGPKGIPRFPKIPGDTSSEASLEWVKERISRCQAVHKPCQSSSGGASFLPTRLVYVGPLNDEGDVVLRDGVSVSGGTRYVALSHCWGTKPLACLTTTATLEARQKRIPWSTLPPTFRDAVDFTRRLGLAYLWIDSLCIVQGDAADWAREAGRMFHVYRNAYVTLAAYHARDSGGGLYSQLSHEPQMRLGSVVLGSHEYALWTRRTFKHYPGLRCHTGEGGADEAHALAPLFTRAWTFQERLVSPRVVLFARGEIIWECARCTACECQATGTADDIHCPKVLYGKSLAAATAAAEAKKRDWMRGLLGWRGPRADDRLQTSNEFVVDRDMGKPPPLSRMSWRVIVAAYSELDLTQRTDRLPALSAVAEQISATRPGQQYLAGCWSGTLIDDLMWETSSQVGNRGDDWKRVAPTWSWASVRSAVGWNHDQTYRPLAEVVGVACTSADGNPFGAPADGELTLRGRLLPCVLEKHRSPDVVISPFSIRHYPSDLIVHSSILLDEDDPDAAKASDAGDAEASGEGPTREKDSQEKSGQETTQDTNSQEKQEQEARQVTNQEAENQTSDQQKRPRAGGYGLTKPFRVELVYKKDVFLLELAEDSVARDVPKGVSWLERDKVCLVLRRARSSQDQESPNKYSRLGITRSTGPGSMQDTFRDYSETATVVIV